MSIAKDFASSIKDATKEKTSSYDTQATVTRIEGKTAWVHIPGGVTETPVQLTVNASEGDAVQVRVANGKAWITGNASAPPTDDKRANAAYRRATDAENEAQLAHSAADTAVGFAETARQAAEDADLAAQAATESAEQAGLAAEQAEQDAQEASDSAKSATASASTAIGQLSQIEDVMRVIDWAARHGTYGVTADTVPVAGKWYFELVDGAYSVVTPSEVDDPHALGLYELTGVDEAMSNYISTHLALTDSGLYVQMDNNAARLQIASTGIVLWGADGKPIAQYTSDVILGDEDSTHIKLTSGELGFYKDKNTKVAYISGNKLYIAESEVTNTQRIGAFIWVKQSSNRISLRYSPQG